jgi:hypothetical protein
MIPDQDKAKDSGEEIEGEHMPNMPRKLAGLSSSQTHPSLVFFLFLPNWSAFIWKICVQNIFSVSLRLCGSMAN